MMGLLPVESLKKEVHRKTKAAKKEIKRKLLKVLKVEQNPIPDVASHFKDWRLMSVIEEHIRHAATLAHTSTEFCLFVNNGEEHIRHAATLAHTSTEFCLFVNNGVVIDAFDVVSEQWLLFVTWLRVTNDVIRQTAPQTTQKKLARYRRKIVKRTIAALVDAWNTTHGHGKNAIVANSHVLKDFGKKKTVFISFKW